MSGIISNQSTSAIADHSQSPKGYIPVFDADSLMEKKLQQVYQILTTTSIAEKL